VIRIQNVLPPLPSAHCVLEVHHKPTLQGSVFEQEGDEVPRGLGVLLREHGEPRPHPGEGQHDPPIPEVRITVEVGAEGRTENMPWVEGNAEKT
jgi:hypothetical protein